MYISIDWFKIESNLTLLWVEKKRNLTLSNHSSSTKFGNKTTHKLIFKSNLNQHTLAITFTHKKSIRLMIIVDRIEASATAVVTVEDGDGLFLLFTPQSAVSGEGWRKTRWRTTDCCLIPWRSFRLVLGLFLLMLAPSFVPPVLLLLLRLQRLLMITEIRCLFFLICTCSFSDWFSILLNTLINCLLSNFGCMIRKIGIHAC